MCGIVGYIGTRSCVDLVFQGLQTLEYRGYDSAGLAILTNAISVVKTKGKLSDLQPLLSQLPESHIAMGHTRWATHGAPTSENAHPHCTNQVAVVHNGIIENYQDLKQDLISKGYKFKSETDTEVVVYLLEEQLRTNSILESIQNVVAKLKGAYSLGLFIMRDPSAVYLVRQGSPNVVGVGDGEMFFASGISGFIKHTKKAIFLEEGTIACLTSNQIDTYDFSGNPKQHQITNVDWAVEQVEKQDYEHYMLKEIFEQPKVLTNNLFRLTQGDSLNMEELGIKAFFQSITKFPNKKSKQITDIIIIGCGTALHAGMVGKYFFDNTNVTVSVELASEFRYRKQKLKSTTLVIAISQSGETADTLASVKYAKNFNCPVFSICNVRFSSLTRESNAVLYMDAGPEIGVAATKSFTSQVLCLYLFSLAFQLYRGDLTSMQVEENIRSLKSLAADSSAVLKQADHIKSIADVYSAYDSHLFIGRGPSYPIALEGALKLKEISYIHAEGTAAGELKHGTIALIDDKMPIVALAPQDHYYEKTVSNIEECLARSGIVLVVGDDRDLRLSKKCHKFIACPHSTNPAAQAILTTIPTQLYAYYSALKRGTNIDQPRNLAKSVTVE